METEIGTRLPADYKEYVNWFGPGGFDEYLVVCVPGVENSNTELPTSRSNGRMNDCARRSTEHGSPRLPTYSRCGSPALEQR
ncbi:SMI1/KNR4 family protein [Streptomyces cyaneofuscatus]